MIPTQPPCCQTLQLSHWMNMLPTSSDSNSEESAGRFAGGSLFAAPEDEEGGRPRP